MKILKCIFTLVVMTWLLNTTPAWSKNDSARLNPVIWADVPDPDVIRVGDTYYMVSTTMHLMPGCPVMRSKNLVDWETMYLTRWTIIRNIVLLTVMCMDADNGLHPSDIITENSMCFSLLMTSHTNHMSIRLMTRLESGLL